MATEAEIKELEANVEFMAKKLEQARELIGDTNVAIPYNNGGGQVGIRRNPAIDGYNALMGTYQRALAQLEEMRAKQPRSAEGRSSLASLRVIAKRDAG